jgi:nitroimidazol reductase NimA-like FMN-containing flavoprotein (pyridoxamine 5'-phosphate oxidase superfamily)
MRRKDKEVTDKKIIDKILNESEFCRVAIHDDEYPYLVPLNYGYSDNTLYFHSAAEGKKIELLKNNNKVCFEIEHAAKTMLDEQPGKSTTKYLTVIGYGEIEIITDTDKKIKGLDIIMNHYGSTTASEYDESQLNRIVILKLTINKITAKRSGNWEI